jgi:hypothetical protein
MHAIRALPKPVENVKKTRETLLTTTHDFDILDGLW